MFAGAVRRLVHRDALRRRAAQAVPAGAGAGLARDGRADPVRPAVVGALRDHHLDRPGLCDRGRRRDRGRLRGRALAHAGAHVRAGAVGHVRGAADDVLPAVRAVLRHRPGLRRSPMARPTRSSRSRSTPSRRSPMSTSSICGPRAPMGASSWQQFRYVYMPAALPVTLTGLRIGFFICIASVLGGETLAATAGVGRATALAAELMETAQALRLDRVRGLHVGDAQPARARGRDAQRAGVTGMSARQDPPGPAAADPRRRRCCGSSTRGCSRPRRLRPRPSQVLAQLWPKVLGEPRVRRPSASR